MLSKVISAAAVAATTLWPALALPGGDSFEESLSLQWTFGAAAPSELSLSLRLEQPAEIGRALADFLGTTAEAAELQRRWLPPRARLDWRSNRGCAVRLNGMSLADESGAAKSEPGMSRTTKYLLGGAALVAVGVAVAGGSSSSEPAGGIGGPGGCVCPNCDGQVSAVCSGGRLDDDGDCTNTTCDTL